MQSEYPKLRHFKGYVMKCPRKGDFLTLILRSRSMLSLGVLDLVIHHWEGAKNNNHLQFTDPTIAIFLICELRSLAMKTKHYRIQSQSLDQGTHGPQHANPDARCGRKNSIYIKEEWCINPKTRGIHIWP